DDEGDEVSRAHVERGGEWQWRTRGDREFVGRQRRADVVGAKQLRCIVGIAFLDDEYGAVDTRIIDIGNGILCREYADERQHEYCRSDPRPLLWQILAGCHEVP